MITSILVAVDESAGAGIALRWAAELVEHERLAGRTVTARAVTVWTRSTFDVTALIQDEQLEAEAMTTLENQLKTLADPDIFEPRVRYGHPADAVLEEAKESGSDLIVVGSRGRSPVAQVLLGSVSRTIATKSEVPVAVVPGSAGAFASPTVVGYDDSPSSKAAVRWALDNCPGAVIAVSAWVLPTAAVYHPSFIEPELFEEETRTKLHAGLEEVCGGAIDPRITPVVQRDDPRLALLDPVHGPTQIVVGARGHRGLAGLLLGSTTTYVATRSEHPVIIVPHGV